MMILYVDSFGRTPIWTEMDSDVRGKDIHFLSFALWEREMPSHGGLVVCTRRCVPGFYVYVAVGNR